MADTSITIRVPKPKASSFNMDRPLREGSLLWHQVKYFEAHEHELPAKHRTGIVLEEITTEGKAAEYIRLMSDILNPPPGALTKEAPARRKRKAAKAKAKGAKRTTRPAKKGKK